MFRNMLCVTTESSIMIETRPSISSFVIDGFWSRVTDSQEASHSCDLGVCLTNLGSSCISTFRLVTQQPTLHNLRPAGDKYTYRVENERDDVLLIRLALAMIL